jgi:hypothetical protein
LKLAVFGVRVATLLIDNFVLRRAAGGHNEETNREYAERHTDKIVSEQKAGFPFMIFDLQFTI